MWCILYRAFVAGRLTTSEKGYFYICDFCRDRGDEECDCHSVKIQRLKRKDAYVREGDQTARIQGGDGRCLMFSEKIRERKEGGNCIEVAMYKIRTLRI